MSTPTTRFFGIITSVSGLQAGICVNSLDTNETVTTAEALNEKGAVTDMVGYSQRRTISVSGVLDSAKGDLVEAGACLTIGTNDYLVTSVQKTESNTGFVTVNLTCEGADDAIITVINDDDSNS